MNIYQSKVGLPGGPTQAQASYQTPVANAIGQAAGVAGQFVQKYQAAKYDRSKIDTMLQVKKNVNEYQENLRNNPITQENPDDDIVAMKEGDWNKFSNDQVRKNVLDKITDPRLKEEMNSWWANETENYRSNVVNNAMDENVAYMGQRAMEDINTAIYEGQYAMAIGIGQSSLENGLINRETFDGIQDQVALQSILQVTDQMNIEDAQKTIDESPLEADEKIKASKYMVERKKVRAEDIAKTVNIYDTTQYRDLYMAAQNGEIRSSEQLTEIFRTMGDAMYGDEVLEGTAADFAAKHMVSLMSVINSKNKKEEPSPEVKLSSIVKEDISARMAKDSREEVLAYVTKMTGVDGYGIQAYDFALTEMNKSQRGRLSDSGLKAYDDKVKDLITDEYITEDEKYAVRKRFDSWIQQFSDEEIMTEAYYDKMTDFFNNMKAEKTTYDINELQKTIVEEGNIGRTSYAEEFIRKGRMGEFVGQTDPTALRNYISGTTGIDDFKEDIARYLYEKPYEELDKDKKSRVNLSVAIGEHSKAVLRYANDTIGPGGRLVVDPKTNMPIVRFGEGDNVTDYMLRVNADKQEEEWWSYGKLSEADTPRWHPSGISIPVRIKDPGIIKSTLTEIEDAINGVVTEESQEIAEDLRLQYLGNTFIPQQIEREETEDIKRARSIGAGIPGINN